MENERLLSVLYRMVELQEQILLELRNHRADKPVPENVCEMLGELIDGVDVKALLKISDSTLYRIKKSKGLTTVRIGKQDYFKAAEIKSLVPFFMK